MYCKPDLYNYFLTQLGFLLFMLVRFKVLLVERVMIYVLENVTPWPSNLRRWSAAPCSLGMQFRIPPGHESLSVVSVVCCQLEVSATG